MVLIGFWCTTRMELASERTPKEVGRVFGIAKFTPSVNSIRDWCKEMVAKYEQTQEDDEVMVEETPTKTII